jgi:hypothetical protein
MAHTRIFVCRHEANIRPKQTLKNSFTVKSKNGPEARAMKPVVAVLALGSDAAGNPLGASTDRDFSDLYWPVDPAHSPAPMVPLLDPTPIQLWVNPAASLSLTWVILANAAAYAVLGLIALAIQKHRRVLHISKAVPSCE